MALRRINKELTDIGTAKGLTYTVVPEDGNPYNWRCTLLGPEGSPYAGGVFLLDIQLPKEYPFKAPKVKFETRVYHCNVNDKGEICLSILKDEWTPANTMTRVLDELNKLLISPNPDDPLIAEIASKYRTDKEGHDKIAAEWTAKYAG